MNCFFRLFGSSGAQILRDNHATADADKTKNSDAKVKHQITGAHCRQIFGRQFTDHENINQRRSEV